MRHLWRRWWPWAKPGKTVFGSASLSVGGSATAHGEVIRREDRPPPASLDEVGERLNHIAAALNSHERALGRLREGFEHEIADARSEASRRHDEIQVVIDEEFSRMLSERKREGILIGLGVLLQFIGAALIVVC